MNQEANRLRRLRRKASALGYSISKGYVHYMSGPVYHDGNGKKEVGYMVIDQRTGFGVYGCYNTTYDHLWSLEDVERFLNVEGGLQMTGEQLITQEIAEGSLLAEPNEDRLDIKCSELSYLLAETHGTNSMIDALAKAYYLGLRRGSKNVTK